MLYGTDGRNKFGTTLYEICRSDDPLNGVRKTCHDWFAGMFASYLLRMSLPFFVARNRYRCSRYSIKTSISPWASSSNRISTGVPVARRSLQVLGGVSLVSSRSLMDGSLKKIAGIFTPELDNKQTLLRMSLSVNYMSRSKPPILSGSQPRSISITDCRGWSSRVSGSQGESICSRFSVIEPAADSH